MKILILATLIVLTAADVKYQVRLDIADQWEELYKPVKQECVQESGVNEEDVRDIFERGHYPDKPEFKCYLKCVGIKLHFLNGDYTFNEQVITTTVKAADLDIVEDSIKFVEDSHTTEPCEKFYLYIITAVAKVAVRYPPKI